MTDTTIRARFSAKYVPLLAPFIPRLDIRYYLCGINVTRAEQGGVYLVATDGHTMAIIYDAGGSLEGADNVIIRTTPALIAACRKSARKAVQDDLRDRVLLDGQRVVLAPDFGMIGTQLETYVQPGLSQIEGKYPDWRKALPNFANLKSGFDASLNAQYLARYASLSSSKYPSLTFWQEHPREVVIVQHHDIPEMISLIMPVNPGQDMNYFRGLMDRYVPLRAQYRAEQETARAGLDKTDGKDQS